MTDGSCGSRIITPAEIKKEQRKRFRRCLIFLAETLSTACILLALIAYFFGNVQEVWEPLLIISIAVKVSLIYDKLENPNR